ncbi:transposase [Salinimonas marina]|uniref:Transposase n=1 Tax=Salinimonas marina TaxID=2785918 RepID=A0A7S9DYQ2_9ALTE|nr:IS3 family transposase [Salinimonas marina]QPG06404.1 transposase [Salinimonas marina]
MRDIINTQALERMRKIHADSGGIIGAPRRYEDLHSEGIKASLNCIARLMLENRLYGGPRRKH